MDLCSQSGAILAFGPSPQLAVRHWDLLWALVETTVVERSWWILSIQGSLNFNFKFCSKKSCATFFLPTISNLIPTDVASFLQTSNAASSADDYWLGVIDNLDRLTDSEVADDALNHENVDEGERYINTS